MNEQTNLRNQLFEKYFEVEEGISLQNFMKDTNFIQETWNNLHQLLEKNLRYFDAWSTLDDIKQVTNQGKDYLIIKLRIWNYIIIDLETNQSVSNEKIRNYFNEEFFIKTFEERKIEDKDCLDMYHFDLYNGSIQELINFYKNNQTVFNLPNHLYYKLMIDQAWTYLSIDLANGQVQLGFETKDQFLYEHLFMQADLAPSRMQDAGQKIEMFKMIEIFERVKDIKLPHSIIPVEFYQQNIISKPSAPKSLHKKNRKPTNK